MDNVTQLPTPRIDLPRVLEPNATPDDLALMVDRVERLLDIAELGLSFHDRLLQFRNAVHYQAYGRRGWRELLQRLDAAVERSGCVHALLVRACRGVSGQR